MRCTSLRQCALLLSVGAHKTGQPFRAGKLAHTQRQDAAYREKAIVLLTSEARVVGIAAVDHRWNGDA